MDSDINHPKHTMSLSKADKAALKRLQRKKRRGTYDGTADKYFQWLKERVNRNPKTNGQ